MTTHSHLRRWTPLLLFVLSFGLHAWGIGSDLPFNYNPDEPHHLRVAAHFSSGDLNPHDFKYPTLWQYTLAGWLGVLYVGGRLLRFTHSAAEFAGQFLYSPTIFYLTARLLASSFIALTAVLFFRIGEKFYDLRTGVAAGALVALSPTMNGIGVEATNYALMMFLVAAALGKAHRILAGERAYAAAGFFTGLAASTHYLAAPLIAVPVVIAFLLNGRKAARPIATCAAAAAGGFALGSPFVLLDFRTAWRDIAQIGDVNSAEVWGSDRAAIIKRAGLIALNIARSLDRWGIGFALALLAFADARRPRWRLIVWWSPLLLLLPLLIKSHFGYLPRYSYSVIVPLFVPAAIGLAFLWEKLRTPPARAALAGGIGLALLFQSAGLATARQRVDTATQAEAWLRANVPAGDTVFVSDPYLGPQLVMEREQTERLWKKNEAAGNPRSELYRVLTLSHPGGGYEVFVLRRSYGEVTDIQRRTDEAFDAVDWVDPVSEGVDGFLKRRIHWAVIDTDYDDPRHDAWLGDLRARFPKVASFSPGAGVKGRPFEIYRLSSEAAPR